MEAGERVARAPLGEQDAVAAVRVLRVRQVAVLELRVRERVVINERVSHLVPYKEQRGRGREGRTSPWRAASESPCASMPTYSKRSAGQRSAARWSSMNRRRFIS